MLSNNFEIIKNEKNKTIDDYEDEIYELLEDEKNKVILGKEKLKLFENKICDLSKDSDYVDLLNQIKRIIKGITKKNFLHINNKKKIYNKNSPEECDVEFNKLIEKIVKEAKNKELKSIGSGMTAEVFVSNINQSYCFKIIKIDKNSLEIYEKYNNLVEETEYLDELVNFKVDDVRSPAPYCYVTTDACHVLVMETLDAASLDDLFSGKEKLPEQFNENTFFNKVESYIEKLNKEKKIYHFDLHAGNIMIDRNTGDPRIIDFGKADTMHLNDEEGFFYRKNFLTGVASQRTKDIERIKILKEDMRRYLYNIKK